MKHTNEIKNVPISAKWSNRVDRVGTSLLVLFISLSLLFKIYFVIYFFYFYVIEF